MFANSRIDYTGKILHLDGDKRYSEKTIKQYKKMGLNAIVKNIPESKQPQLVIPLLQKYNPDILIITGHDSMIRKGRNYLDISNYRNSKYFVKSGIILQMNFSFLQEHVKAFMKQLWKLVQILHLLQQEY